MNQPFGAEFSHFLVVQVGTCTVQQRSNYFIVAELNLSSLPPIAPLLVKRTEVVRQTSNPKFDRNVFHFGLTPNVLGVAHASLARSPPSVVLRLFEVPEESHSSSDGPSVRGVGVAELKLSQLLQSSRQDPKSPHNSSGDKLQLSQTVHFVSPNRYRKSRANSGGPNDSEAFSLGKIHIDVSASSSNQPASVLPRSGDIDNDINNSERVVSFQAPGSLPRSVAHTFISAHPAQDDDDMSGARFYSSGSNVSYIIRCFGVNNLSRPTRTFVTVKTTEDIVSERPARSGTATTPPVRNYVWYEPLVVDIATRDDAGKEKLGLVISLVDANNRSFIGRCILPCEDIIPGEQYNVALVLDGQAKSCLFLSIMLQSSLQFQTYLFLKHPSLCRIEVYLHGVRVLNKPSASGRVSVHEDKGTKRQDSLDAFGPSVVAALHYEEDLTAYIKKISKALPQPPFQGVSLDDGSAWRGIVPTIHQLTPPSQFSLHPQWNTLLEFTHTADELFAPSAAIVIELYSFDFPRDREGEVRFTGWTAVPLSSLTKAGIHDGDIVSQSAVLHGLMHQPPSGKAHISRAPTPPQLRQPNQVFCQSGDQCDHHRFAVALELRRWVSRSFVRHLLNIKAKKDVLPSPVSCPPQPKPAPLLRSRSSQTSFEDFKSRMKAAGLPMPVQPLVQEFDKPAPLMRSQSSAPSTSIEEWARARKQQQSGETPNQTSRSPTSPRIGGSFVPPKLKTRSKTAAVLTAPSSPQRPRAMLPPMKLNQLPPKSPSLTKTPRSRPSLTKTPRSRPSPSDDSDEDTFYSCDEESDIEEQLSPSSSSSSKSRVAPDSADACAPNAAADSPRTPMRGSLNNSPREPESMSLQVNSPGSVRSALNSVYNSNVEENGSLVLNTPMSARDRLAYDESPRLSDASDDFYLRRTISEEDVRGHSDEEDDDAVSVASSARTEDYMSSPMLANVLNKVEKMLTKKLRKKQRNINDLKQQLEASHAQIEQLRRDFAEMQRTARQVTDENGLLQREVNELRREKMNYLSRSTQLPYRTSSDEDGTSAGSGAPRAHYDDGYSENDDEDEYSDVTAGHRALSAPGTSVGKPVQVTRSSVSHASGLGYPSHSSPIPSYSVESSRANSNLRSSGSTTTSGSCGSLGSSLSDLAEEDSSESPKHSESPPSTENSRVTKKDQVLADYRKGIHRQFLNPQSRKGVEDFDSQAPPSPWAGAHSRPSSASSLKKHSLPSR